MKFIVSMSDHVTDTSIVKKIEAADLFDAINIATSMIDHPKDTELIEAFPVFEGVGRSYA